MKRLRRASLLAALLALPLACADVDRPERQHVDEDGSDEGDLEARNATRTPRTSVSGRGFRPFGRKPITRWGGTPTSRPSASGEAKPDAPAQPAPAQPRPDAPTPAPGPAGAGPRFYVSPSGSDSASGSEQAPFRSIAHALRRVTSGTIVVRQGTYAERLVIKRTGSSEADYLNLVAAPGEDVRLVGEGAGRGEGGNMIYLQGASYVRIEGFRIIGAGRQDDASGVRIMGSGHHIDIVNNEISEIRGESAMGITVYGKDGPGITDVHIRGNRIHDCDPAPSEALTLNGNVRRFEVVGNEVRDVNNIGIDVIGGETWLSRAFPSEGRLAENVVTRANSSYDGSAACIYVDGASQLTIEGNRVSQCDYGIEVGAENRGVVAQDVVVRNNFVFRNYRGGIIFGGYDAQRGRVRSSRFVHNSLFKNGRPNEQTRFGYKGGANGEIIVQYADDCEISNNILYGIGEASTVGMWGRSSNLRWSNNLHYRDGQRIAGLPEPRPVVGDPRFRAPEAGDLHIREDSPARGAGPVTAYSGTIDIDGEPRDPAGSDLGADEI